MLEGFGFMGKVGVFILRKVFELKGDFIYDFLI